MSLSPAATSLRMSAQDWALLLFLSLLWGGSFFFVELVVDQLPAQVIVLLRVSVAAALLALVMVATGTAFPRGKTVWLSLAMMGLLNNVLPFSLLVLAQSQIPGGLAAILNATTPLFTLLVAHFATRDERLSLPKVLGLLFGFGGVVVMMGGAALHSGLGTVLAQLACLGAALSYGFAGVWGRRFGRFGISPLGTAFGMLVAASLWLAPVVFITAPPWTLAMPDGAGIAAILGLAVLSTSLAYLIYFRLLARAGAVNLSLVTFLVPASAIALGVLVLGEVLEPRHLAGLALIAAGLACIDGRIWRRR